MNALALAHIPVNHVFNVLLEELFSEVFRGLYPAHIPVSHVFKGLLGRYLLGTM